MEQMILSISTSPFLPVAHDASDATAMMHVAQSQLAPPSIPAGLVPRPALLEALDRGDDRALTVVCAPPGYGKSLLLSHWVRERADASTSWVNLEPHDNDPRRLWSAVLTALRACPGVPADSRLHRLVVSRTSVESEFLADLVDALDRLPSRIRLILDNAHTLVTPESLYGLQLIMCSPRPRLRLVLATQRDPGLPVARLRLEEQLCELRAQQLQFSAEESALLLQRQGVRLAAEHMAALQERTGGWPAGLRFAALRLRGHPDPGSFVDSFSGDERPVADYLVGEVLEHIPEDELDVLRSTSICDPIPAKLAVELSDREDAAELLDRLEHDTGLVVGIDAQRATYRAQQLLRSYLAADLMRSGPGRVAALHRRAALWNSAQGRAQAVLHHAARAADGPLMTDLLHRWSAELIARGEHRALLRAFKSTNRDAGRNDPWCAVVSAQLHLTLGDRRKVAADVGAARMRTSPADGSDLAVLLTATERLAGLTTPGEPNELGDKPEPDDPALAALALTGRAAARLAAGALGGARRDAGRALHTARRLGLGLLELQSLSLLSATEWASGDYRAAAAASSASCKAAVLGGWEDSVWAAGACAVSAHAALMRAHPRDALCAAEQGLRAACTRHDPVIRFALRTARGGALSDTGEAVAGLLELQQARDELGGTEVPGQLATAAAVLEHRSALSSGYFTAAAAAINWLTERGSGQHEQTLMRAWTETATGAHRAARTTVEFLQAQHGLSQLPCTVIDVGLLHAAAALRDGQRTAARHALRTALHRAEKLDALRPFALAEPAVRALLVDQLGDADNRYTFAYRAFHDTPRMPLPHTTPLSAREREVLDQLPSLRTVDEIATNLAVSTNTIKTHVRAIYRKLGVSSRRTAVLAAHEQCLL
jgi:LuxR family maltose regulon positive regulatory protein